MKYLMILFLAFFGLFSCNAKNQTTEAEASKDSEKKVEIDKNTLIWAKNESLPNYSYKNYKIEPFLSFDYKMPILIGSEWLVLYFRINNKELIRELKLCTIQDSIYASFRKDPHIIEYSSPDIDSMYIPFIDKGLSNPEAMFFFKGFEKYNTNFANDYINDKFSDFRDYREGEDNDSVMIIHYDIRYNNKPFFLQDTYIQSSDSVKIVEGEDIKEYAHYIIYKNESQSQCLIYRQADRELFFPLEFHDLDGDGLPDLIFNINYNTEVKDAESEIYSSYSSYLLYLSSEADEGELLKHVATKTILNSRTVYPLTK